MTEYTPPNSVKQFGEIAPVLGSIVSLDYAGLN
jgi:hypothetical protein